MKEFIEKLIGRLEEAGEYHLELSEANKMDVRESHRHKSFAGVYGNAISIVNELAEEYGKDTNVTTNGWIPCSERLPSVDYISGVSETVLVTTTYGNSIFTAEYHRNGIWLDDVCGCCLSVIAWQPLPEPYTEGEQE